jgi:hypothetical protein
MAVFSGISLTWMPRMDGWVDGWMGGWGTKKGQYTKCWQLLPKHIHPLQLQWLLKTSQKEVDSCWVRVCLCVFLSSLIGPKRIKRRRRKKKNVSFFFFFFRP